MLPANSSDGSAITVASTTFPVSSVNLLQNSARSWYDAGYVSIRRRYSNGLSLLANYTWAKSLTNAPDFRSPMWESSVAQNNSNLEAEKGLGCDIRHRFALSAVYAIRSYNHSDWTRRLTSNWLLATVFQAQSGFPFTISVFGDTANAGTVLGKNPIRANYTGQPVFEFTITETVRFQFRFESFNTLNRSNFGTPNRFVNTPQFGTITDAAGPGRELQLSARLTF